MSKPLSKKFLDAYLEAAVWSSTDPDTDEPLDKEYSISDFTKASIKKATEDCNKFIQANLNDLMAVANDDQHGHDFWLTRNRHGVGFWDRNYPKELGERLTKSAQAFGEAYVQPYRGKLHLYPS